MQWNNFASLNLVVSCQFSVIIATVAKRKKMLHYKHEPDRYILPMKKWVDWISARWEKMLQPQKCTFWENGLGS